MTSNVVTERNVLAVVRPLLSAAIDRIWVTAPWVTTGAADLWRFCAAWLQTGTSPRR
jgi:hypothetical protein